MLVSSKGSASSCFGVEVGVGSLLFADQKCFFFGGGLPLEETIGDSQADKGLFGMVKRPSVLSSLTLENSSAASAVLGLFAAVRSKTGGLIGAKDSSGLAGGGLTIELMLFVTEWPQMVELLRSVSEEIIERGRGITSTRSEKSTVRDRAADTLRLLCGDAGGDRVAEGIGNL